MPAPTSSPNTSTTAAIATAPSMSAICAGHSCARTQRQIWRSSDGRRGRGRSITRSPGPGPNACGSNKLMLATVAPRAALWARYSERPAFGWPRAASSWAGSLGPASGRRCRWRGCWRCRSDLARWGVGVEVGTGLSPRARRQLKPGPFGSPSGRAGDAPPHKKKPRGSGAVLDGCVHVKDAAVITAVGACVYTAGASGPDSTGQAETEPEIVVSSEITRVLKSGPSPHFPAVRWSRKKFC